MSVGGEKINLKLEEVMDCIVRSANMKDFDNVIYFANTVRKQWIERVEPIKRKFEFISETVDKCQ